MNNINEINIDEILKTEIDNIKDCRTEERKRDRKSKYSTFPVKCLYNNYFKNEKGRSISFIYDIVINRDEIYKNIIALLNNSEYILNKSYLVKYISYKTEVSKTTVYNKLDELIQLDVVEYVGESVRLTRLAIRNILKKDIKTINYKTDSKTRTKLRINMYSKGHTNSKQINANKKLSKILNQEIDLKTEKIMVLNDKEILVLYKGLTPKSISCIEYYIKEMNRVEVGMDIKRIYITNKRTEGISINGIETELLKDVIDFNEHNNKKNTERK